jgi:two-component system chemotaxis response regulator CheY
MASYTTNPSSAAAPAARPTVLIVDGDPDTRALYCAIFPSHEFVVETCEDGAEALGRAICQPPDLIIMETQIRRINGFELCRLLRSDLATRSAAIVVVTSAATVVDKQRAITAGADAVLTKPCAYEDVVAVGQQLLDRASSAGDMVAEPDGPGAAPGPTASGAKRRHDSRSFQRGRSTAPPRKPPPLRCPTCDEALSYDHSFIGGVTARFAEQWDYFDCPRCGPYQYRHRTRVLKATT